MESNSWHSGLLPHPGCMLALFFFSLPIFWRFFHACLLWMFPWKLVLVFSRSFSVTVFWPVFCGWFSPLVCDAFPWLFADALFMVFFWGCFPPCLLLFFACLFAWAIIPGCFLRLFCCCWIGLFSAGFLGCYPPCFLGLFSRSFVGTVLMFVCWGHFPACLLWLFHQLLSGGVFPADG